MSHTEFFPYPFEAQALTLDYRLEQEDLRTDERGKIRADGVADTADIKLAFEVHVAEDTLTQVLPAAELADPQVEVMVTVRSIASRTRRKVRLSDTGGVWAGTLEDPKRELYGELTLEPMLVRTAKGSDPGYAQHVGARLAGGEPVTVQVDEPPISSGGFLDIKFEVFRESGAWERRKQPNLLYWLETESRETPRLWLNEGIPHLKPVVFAKGPRGYNVRIRDAFFDTLVSQVWTTLAAIAFTSLALAVQAADGEEEADPIAELPDWQQHVIDYWALRLFVGTRAECLEALSAEVSASHRLPGLFDRLSRAVQKHAQSTRAFQGLIRIRDREGV